MLVPEVIHWLELVAKVDHALPLQYCMALPVHCICPAREDEQAEACDPMVTGFAVHTPPEQLRNPSLLARMPLGEQLCSGTAKGVVWAWAETERTSNNHNPVIPAKAGTQRER
jgi:hypothetical protein